MHRLAWVVFLLSIAPSVALADEPSKPTPITIVSPAPALDDQKIDAIYESLLTHEGTIDVVDRPLEEVAAWLSEQWYVPIRIHERALEDVALSSDFPVKFRIQDVSRDTLIRWMLFKLDLAYDIDATGVVITTPDDLKTHGLVTRVYSIEDLIDGVFSDEAGLMRVLTDCIRPDDWARLGGPGQIVVSNQRLIVEHTLFMQAKVRGLLENLMELKLLDPMSTSTVSSPGHLMTKWKGMKDFFQSSEVEASPSETESP